jgi:ribonuclease HI
MKFLIYYILLYKMDNISIYCDGSALNNGKSNSKGGIGIYIDNKEYEDFNVSEQIIDTYITNQRTEIIALTRVFEMINSGIFKQFKESEINVYSDSEYTLNCLKWIPMWIKKNWKKADNCSVKNRDLLEILWDEYNKTIPYNLNLYHIRSHTNGKDRHSIGNDKADKLANLCLK